MLKTQRLILRKWTKADAESLFEYAKNSEVVGELLRHSFDDFGMKSPYLQRTSSSTFE